MEGLQVYTSPKMALMPSIYAGDTVVYTEVYTWSTGSTHVQFFLWWLLWQ